MFKEILLAIVIIGVVSTLANTTTAGIEIQAPQTADVLKGSVEVTGSISELDFISASLYYAYADTTVETWFLIQTIQKPVKAGKLAKWDTSLITDGNYKLKLSVLRKSGEIQEVIVDHLQVRNYTAAEDIVPTQTLPPVEPNLTPTVIPTQPVVTATQFPINRAAISNDSVTGEIKKGMILGVFSVLAFGIYTAMRGWFYRR